MIHSNNMENNLASQISNVRKQISEVFSARSSPILPTVKKNFKSNLRQEKVNLRLSKKPVMKEYLSLPNISVHRNPMALISERDIGKHKFSIRKKHVGYGGLGYVPMFTIADNDIDWDKMLSTCKELIKKRC